MSENKHTSENDASPSDADSPETPSSNGELNGQTAHPPLPSEPVPPPEPDESSTEPSLAPSEPADNTRAELEDRIRRLEDALVQLHEMKERQAREAAQPPPTAAIAAPLATIVGTPSQPAPFTTTPSDAATSFLFNVGKQFMTSQVAAPPQAAAPPDSTFTIGMRWTWFFFETWAEARAIYRMFVDPRYRLSWASRVAPIVLLALLMTSGYWAPGAQIPGIGTLIDKIIDLPLAFLLFKMLSHEARRYRETSPDLPPGMRLPDR